MSASGRRDDGVPKLWLHRRILELRSRRPDALMSGATYTPIRATGDGAVSIVAYARGNKVVVVVPRVSGNTPAHARLELPGGEWLALDGAAHRGWTSVGDLLATFPVAVLERTE